MHLASTTPFPPGGTLLRVCCAAPADDALAGAAGGSTVLPTHRDQLFDEVYREHLGLMARVTHAFAVERPDREDLFQEILVAVWQALPRFQQQAKLSTYIYRVALSCALNWKRSRQRYRHKVDCFARELPDVTEPQDPRTRERLRWLYAKIHQLPPVDRTLMLLHLDQQGHDDIAAITGLTKANIAVRLHRIKQQLTHQSEEIKNEY
jgi:RNA polymerase sigma-70 factor (ECF subfamily)